MKNRKCSNCYFGDKCEGSHACEDYSPIYDVTDDEIAKIIDNRRREFLSAWMKYIEDYRD